MDGSSGISSPRMIKTVRVADDQAPTIQVGTEQTTVRVIATSITDHGFAQIQFHAGLRELDLSCAPITNSMLVKLGEVELPRLKVFRVARCEKLMDDRLTAFLKGLRERGVRLEVLDMSGLSKLTNQSVVEVGQHSGLRVLLLNGCKGPNDHGFLELKLASLVQLDLGGTAITGYAFNTMMAKYWTHLEKLGVAFCEKLSLKGLPNWAPFKEGRIRCFDARRDKPLSAEEATALVKGIPSHMSDLRLPAMREDPKALLGKLALPYRALDLSGFEGLTDREADKLLKSLNRNTLEELHLSGCTKLTWRFFGKLKDWVNASRLRCLSLAKTSIGDAALGQLAKHPFDALDIAYCKGLTEEVFEEVKLDAQSLNLAGLPVTDGTVVSMLAKKKLLRLNLRDTQVTMAGILALLSNRRIGALTLPSDEVVIEGGKWAHSQFYALAQALHEGTFTISLSGLRGLGKSSWDALVRNCPSTVEELTIANCDGFTLAHLKTLLSRATNLKSVTLCKIEGLYREAASAALKHKVKGITLLDLRKESESPRARLAHALDLLERGGQGAEKAIGIIKELMEELPEALYWYGMAVFEGKGGLQPNEAGGKDLVLQAAGKNCPLAFIRQGLWVIEEGDLGTGLGWLRRAAEEGDLLEAKHLCFLHARKEKKQVTDQDIKWLQEAANEDYVDALFLNGLRIWTGKHLLKGEKRDKKWGRERIEWAARKQCAQATEWLENNPKNLVMATLSRASGTKKKGLGNSLSNIFGK